MAHVVSTHVCKWVPLDEASGPAIEAHEGRVQLNGGYLGTGARGLVFALARNPSPEATEGPSQWADLTHAAALLVAVQIEGEKALAANEGLDFGRFRKSVLDSDVVVLLD
ncbi:ribosomal protein S12 methylthiotransferase RimO [Striga asiatica]|uniref:Ribosomal protein S12 methylthiotransferase RimO n=1 Tax=Striga asiatica TaxID=4170 RepID=A0A5A7RGH3_STRAF|nr:ribosomal protein S12 methylthiotransferase RimO [Striga asiatica]